MQPPVFRPRDVEFWRNPAKELSRLAAAGVVVSPLHGYYVVVSAGRVGDRSWRPTMEGFALALAQRVADVEEVALMGVSAARLHGALPRAVAAAVVAVGEQRRALRTDWGEVVFVARDVGVLDLQRADADLTAGWVTTVEQTLLDIADRPTLGGVDARAASEVIAALAPRAEWDALADLAQRQRRRAAYARARWVADAVIDADAPLPVVPSHRDRYAAPLGLRPVAPTDPVRFGVAAGE
jgi:predicted transcriptional regulator of viral defense system